MTIIEAWVNSRTPTPATPHASGVRIRLCPDDRTAEADMPMSSAAWTPSVMRRTGADMLHPSALADLALPSLPGARCQDRAERSSALDSMGDGRGPARNSNSCPSERRLDMTMDPANVPEVMAKAHQRVIRERRASEEPREPITSLAGATVGPGRQRRGQGTHPQVRVAGHRSGRSHWRATGCERPDGELLGVAAVRLARLGGGEP